ncbi:winged helix DNA-binding protein [Candidatus Daviesbacteria bacterium]|nr:winged helix DNA-binding protein [Candidatus Daviesbacteria bacterium]
MGMEVRRGSLSYSLLTFLEKSIDGYVRLEDFTYHHYRYRYGIPELKKSALSKAIARLKEKGLIETDKKDIGQVVLKLTDEGKTVILLTGDGTASWDGKWRIVIFDIPEQKRLIRDLFRRNLKKWGFKHFQKSVWISKKNVTDKLFNYIRDLGVEKWVWVFESEKYGPLDIQ